MSHSLIESTTPERAPARRPVLRLLRESLLTIGAVLGVLCLLSSAAAVAFDVKPVIFRSGSMAPAVPTGALGFSQTVDASELAVGDVVTVEAANGQLVTHRIVGVTQGADTATLVLQGDANAVPDADVYVVESAQKLLFDIPKAGYVVAEVNGPVGIFAGGLLVGGVLMLVLRDRGGKPGPRGRDEDRPDRADELDDAVLPPTANTPKRGGRRKAFALATSTLVATGLTVGPLAPSSTSAYYADTATVTGGTFQANAIAPPSFGCSASSTGLLNVQLNTLAGVGGYQLNLAVLGTVGTTYTTGPSGSFAIDLSTTPPGIYVLSAIAVGTDGGLSASVSLGTVVILNLFNQRYYTAVCLDVNLNLPLPLPAPAPLVETTPELQSDAVEDVEEESTPTPEPTPSDEPSPSPDPEPTPTLTETP
ncbi:signal peptidase I [Aeromicrobium sp. Leaf350]|uniref:signal peptidase I n=1 Tax=Aeromicrobium sp. Leaf350 TaxID=2876565 RepID=UPI001E575C4C|nr:signal peptidase I [Aeromicrobium sp. Leaf350]